MPTEILSSILQHLSQPHLCALMPLSKNMIEVVAAYLYHTPYFDSTYRFAQFSQTITANPALASLVLVLDLSHFEPASNLDAEEKPQMEPQAGWRELQHINTDLYYIYRRSNTAPPFDYGNVPSHRKSLVSFARIREMERRGQLGRELYSPQGSFLRSSHPLPSPVLRSWAEVRDIPIGGLVRVLAACRGLSKINLSRLMLAPDFLMLHPNTPSENLKPNAHPKSTSPFAFPTATFSPLHHRFATDSPPAHQPLYVSLVERETRSESGNGNGNIVPIYPDDIIYWLTRLPHLQSLEARECVWMTTVRAWMLLCGESGCEGSGCDVDVDVDGQGEPERERERRGKRKVLKEVDFTGCGLAFDSAWAVRGPLKVVAGILGRMVEKRGAEGLDERSRSVGRYCFG